MKKLLMLLTLLFIVNHIGQAQTGTNKYYMDGTMSIGRGLKVFADSSAWVHIGGDTTKKGIIIPNVLLDSIKTTKRGLFVYSLEDSVLYHFDDTNKVRYMTYRDTTMIKNLTGIGSGGSGCQDCFEQGGNAFGAAATLGTTDNQQLDISTNNSRVASVFPSGNVKFGSDGTDNGYSLEIDGSGDNSVLHLHRDNHSTFLKTTTNNDNAYVHKMEIGRHRIQTKGYGISFSANDNEDVVPLSGDIFRIKNVYNSSYYFPFKILGASEEPFLTVTGLGSLLVGMDPASASSLYKLQVNGALSVKSTISGIYNPSQPYLKIEGNESLVLQSSNGVNGAVFLGLSGVSPDFNYPFTSIERTGVVVNRDVTPVSGSADITFNGFVVRNIVDFSNVTGENLYRGIYYNPSITGNVEQRAFEIGNTGGWGIYQTGSGVKNYFNGTIELGSATQLVNTASPSSSAVIDIASTTKGVLLPRMTTTERDAITAVEGLEIYNMTTHKKQVYDGTTWQDCW